MKYEELQQLLALIAAHPDRQVIGRERLQKEVRLLQRIGFPTHYVYRVHFYGPYSEELQSDVDALEAMGWLEQRSHHAGDDEPYITIPSVQDRDLPDISPFQSTIDTLAITDLVVLELAAAYDTFREFGYDPGGALDLLRAKKGAKCDGGRVEQALNLLSRLGLQRELALA